MKKWFKSALSMLLALTMVLGWIVILPDAAVPAQAAYTGNAQTDVTIFPSEMIDGVEWTGRFPSVTRLADGSLMAACYWHPVSLHASFTYDDPRGIIKVAYGSADGKTWSEPTTLVTADYLGENGFGVWRDDAGNFYYDAEEATAANASIQIDVNNPNLHVMNDGTILLDFFIRAPWEVPYYGRELEDCSSSNIVTSPAGVLMMTSKDGGQTWSTPTMIPTQYITRGAAKRGTIAEYDDGQLLIPIYGYDEVQSNAYCGSCVLAELNEDGTWNFIRETRMWGATGSDPSTYSWQTEHAMAVTTLNGQEVTYDLIRRSGNLLISYDRGATWEVVAENVEGSDSWFEGAGENLQQPSIVKMDGSNKLIFTWTEAIGTLGQRNVYGKIYTPGEDWSKTSAVLLYKHNPGGGNDIGDATTIQLTNGELFTIYYDVASRRVGGVFSTVDELTVLRSERELVSTAPAWKFIDVDFEDGTVGANYLMQNGNGLWMDVYSDTKTTIGEENGNKYLTTSIGESSASNACWWFNNVSSDATLTFDFKMPDTLESGWQQISVAFGQDNGRANVIFNNKPGVTEVAFSDNAGNLSPTYQGNATTTTTQKYNNVFASGAEAPWYSVKIIWDDYWVYVKIWEKGTDEPENYTFRNQNAQWNLTSKIFIKVTGGAAGTHILMDNVTVSKKTNLSLVEIDENTLGYRFDRDVTYELPVPVVTWSSSDPSVISVDQNGNLSYVGAGTATVTATCNNLSASKEITVGGWNVIDLDFEDDAAGDWVVPNTYGMSFTNYNKTGATKTIVVENGNKYLKINHNAKFVSEIWFPAGPDVTMQFDYQLPSTITTGWHSLVIAPVDNLNYTWQINNLVTSNVRFVNAGALTNEVNNAMSVGTDSPWYTAKITRNGTSSTLTIWEQGKPDTILYNQTVTNSNFTGDKMCIFILIIIFIFRLIVY